MGLPLRGSSLHAAAFRRLEAPPCRADQREKEEHPAALFGKRCGGLHSPFSGATAGCTSRVFSITSSRSSRSSTSGSVKHAVEWGLANRNLSGIEAIGVDEVQWRSGHTYLTLVYQIDTVKRLLWVAEERTEKSLRGFFESLTAEVKAGIQFVASDMWKPYLKVIAEQISAALHVLDRFHIMRNMNVAIDEVRRAEAAQM